VLQRLLAFPIPFHGFPEALLTSVTLQPARHHANMMVRLGRQRYCMTAFEKRRPTMRIAAKPRLSPRTKSGSTMGWK
jgi:hypothetical protein